MKKQIKQQAINQLVELELSKIRPSFHRELDKARRTNFFLFLIGMLFGCAGTLIGIGIGLWTGVI